MSCLNIFLDVFVEPSKLMTATQNQRNIGKVLSVYIVSVRVGRDDPNMMIIIL